MSLISVEQLHHAAPAARPDILDAIAAHADNIFPKYGLDRLNRVWGFFSVAIEETGGLRSLTENMNYSAEQAHRVFPTVFPTVQNAVAYAHNPEAFANRVYGGRMGNNTEGDGWKYRGQGLIQITGHDNFASLERLTGLPLLQRPELVISEPLLLECAAALFVRYPGILDYCDSGQWHAVWALVGSGRATGRIINLPAHESALTCVQSAISSLGETRSPQLAPQAPSSSSQIGEARQEALAPNQDQAALTAALTSLVGRLESAIAQIGRPP